MPQPDTGFDTMRIEAGVQFFFAKVPIYKGFPIPFNDNRLYGDSEMVTAEPVSFSALLKMLGWRILQGFQSLFHFLKKRCFSSASSGSA